MAKQNNKKPIRIKAGRGVVAKLWKNSNQNGEWYNVTITRVYTDDEGEFVVPRSSLPRSTVAERV